MRLNVSQSLSPVDELLCPTEVMGVDEGALVCSSQTAPDQRPANVQMATRASGRAVHTNT